MNSSKTASFKVTLSTKAQRLPVIRNRLAIVSYLSDYMADPNPIEVNAIAFQDADVPKNKTKGHTIPVLQNWRTYLPKIQSAQAYHLVTTPNHCWINRDDWMCECIGAGYGNFVEILQSVRTNGGLFHEIHASAYNMNLSQTNPKTFKWETHPHLFGKETARREDGTIINPGAGVDCYFPIIKRTRHLWIHDDFVELFPPLPAGASGYCLQGASVYAAMADYDRPLRLARKPGELIHPYPGWKLQTGSVIPPVVE